MKLENCVFEENYRTSFTQTGIHNVLTNNSKVYTESEGEEPNRCVVIKPKED